MNRVCIKVHEYEGSFFYPPSTCLLVSFYLVLYSFCILLLSGLLSDLLSDLLFLLYPSSIQTIPLLSKV